MRTQASSFSCLSFPSRFLLSLSLPLCLSLSLPFPLSRAVPAYMLQAWKKETDNGHGFKIKYYKGPTCRANTSLQRVLRPHRRTGHEHAKGGEGGATRVSDSFSQSVCGNVVSQKKNARSTSAPWSRTRYNTGTCQPHRTCLIRYDLTYTEDGIEDDRAIDLAFNKMLGSKSAEASYSATAEHRRRADDRKSWINAYEDHSLQCAVALRCSLLQSSAVGSESLSAQLCRKAASLTTRRKPSEPFKKAP